MKKAIILVAATVLATGAFAASKEKTEVKCPVMTTMKVNIKQATKDKKFVDYKGRRYFVCCDHCLGEMKKNPAKYKNAESIPTPKVKKKK